MYLCKIQLDSVAQRTQTKSMTLNSLLTAYFYSCTGLIMVIMRRCFDRKPVSGKISSIQCKKCENHTLIIAVDHKTCSVRMNFNLRFMSNKFTCVSD